MDRKYKIVTLCGDAEYEKDFAEEYKKLTAERYIVISAEDFGEKKYYRDMYRHKIGMSDEIYVINAGESIGENVKL